MSILCVLHDLRDDCRAGFAPAVCHLLRERELDDLHKLRFCFKLDPVRNVFEDKSQSSLAHDCASPAIFKVSACLPGAGDTRGGRGRGPKRVEVQKALSMLKCVLFQPQASAYLWFCTDREVESLSEVVSMLAMGAIEFTSYLYENIELGRLGVFSKEWPVDCILRHVASNHGIVCFRASNVSGSAISWLTDVLVKETYACLTALGKAAFLQMIKCFFSVVTQSF